jgi:hypothetical protein
LSLSVPVVGNAHNVCGLPYYNWRLRSGETLNNDINLKYDRVSVRDAVCRPVAKQ